MLKPLIAAFALAASPVVAQPAPPEILGALVRQAPMVRAVDPQGVALDVLAAIGFVTRLIYELGIAAPQNDESYSLGAACVATEDPLRWACREARALRCCERQERCAAATRN